MLAAALRGAGSELHEVATRALASASTLAHPARCVAVVRAADLPVLEAGSEAAATGLQLHGVGDPGNVGALVRSAAALGPAYIALGERCADPLGPKAVRASMGALFRVAVVPLASAPPARVVALEASARDALSALDLDGSVAFALGAERDGLPAEVLARADARARIPQEPGEDSLNVAMAGTVALYELRRRRW